ncbi:MAG: HAMP domain-containing histidine kinase [Oscillospiraceae bacterium]|nr:HAMP domain-containing histidine kinase [Oscillospiraceae bacterium]
MRMLLKNGRLGRQFCLCCLIVLLCAAGAAWFSLAAGLIVLGGGAALCAVFLLSSRARYRELARLSEDIDRILHGQEQLLLEEYREGELSILHSEIQKMTVRLKEQTDALQRDKVRLSQAIADISHQLRTPLTAMNLTASMLSGEELTHRRRLELTRELKRSLGRMDWLVEALLKLAQLDAGTVQMKREPVALGELIEQAAKPLLIPMELRSQALQITVKDESFTGDFQWTLEAVANVLKNAVEHTPAGGIVSVTAEENALFTGLVIEDSGPGFAPEELPHLFQRFYKGKNARPESVGIGLALARQIIAEQNGTISAANRPEGGAQFTLRFYKSVL